MSSDLVPQLVTLVDTSLTNRNAVEAVGGPQGVLKLLTVDPKTGLSDAEIAQRQKLYGTNLVKQKSERSSLKTSKVLLSLLKWLLSLALFGLCLAKTLLIERFWPIKTTIILTVTSIVILVFQIYDLFNKIKNRTSPSRKIHSGSSVFCNVIRNGQVINIKSSDLVLGDIVKLEPNTFIPADMVVIENNNLETEAKPVALKTEENILVKNLTDVKTSRESEENQSLVGSSSVLLSGTTITSGNGLGVVVAIGKNTFQYLSSNKTLTAEKEKKKLKKHTPYGLISSYDKALELIVPIVSIAILIIKAIYFGAGNRADQIKKSDGTYLDLSKVIDAESYLKSAIIDVPIACIYMWLLLPRFVKTVFNQALSYAKQAVLKSKVYVNKTHIISVLANVDDIIVDQQLLKDSHDLEAIKKIKESGIRVRLFASSKPSDAKDFAATFGIDNALVAQGDQIKEDTIANLTGVDVIAQPNPNTKLLFVKELQNQKKKVAVFVSTLEDLPVVRKADVAIALSQAPETLKDASDIVLVKNGVTPVLNTLQAGRQLWISSRRILAHHATFVFSILLLQLIANIVVGDDMFTDTKIIWMVFMNFLVMWASTTDQGDETLLKSKVQDPKKLFTKGMIKLVSFQILAILIVIVVLFASAEKWVPDDDIPDHVNQELPSVTGIDGNIPNGRLWKPFGNHPEEEEAALYLEKIKVYALGTNAALWNFLPEATRDTVTRLSDAILYYEKWMGNRHFTLIFNAFVVMNIFGLLIMRRLWAEFNIFKGLWANLHIWLIFSLMILAQFVLGNYGSHYLQLYPLGMTVVQWVIAYGSGVFALLIAKFWRLFLSPKRI